MSYIFSGSVGPVATWTTRVFCRLPNRIFCASLSPKPHKALRATPCLHQISINILTRS